MENIEVHMHINAGNYIFYRSSFFLLKNTNILLIFFPYIDIYSIIGI